MTLILEPQRRVFTVSELNGAVQRLFESEFCGIWVAGEISGCRQAPSGHYYFSLKDEASQLRCALFKGNARFVKFRPQEGLAVLARGSLEVYEAKGEYQLIVEALEPQGAGALQLAFEQLKKKLSSEGLFDAARKRPLPKLPRRIGVVTSPGGAVIRDMLHVLERRFPGLHIRVYPAQVQGEGAVEQVCRGLEYWGSSEWAEVVILARGGGSLEDLWTFNEEGVARQIAASRVPVISAIGHETDFTIADFVADLRAPTPSAAAEIVICTRDSLLDQISGCVSKAVQAVRYRLAIASRDLSRMGVERSSTVVHRLLTRHAQRLDEMDLRLERASDKNLSYASATLSDLKRRLENSDLRLRLAQARHRRVQFHEALTKQLQTDLLQRRHRWESLTAHLRQLSPLSVLSRGYAIVQDPQGHVLRSASEAAIGDSLHVRFAKGRLAATVSEIQEERT